ncbi:ankyrin repeat-containing protein ITN1-like [Triticum dicoccoides]|uniref:ankyrin repeat-containing protein ITN1-like n=1 Tax=Triticum dicoccoides TaxID=85692 RepID=UPI00188F80B2|nr:ankyrin repeat-containing protein ITN1-like [Triticum dicoccoides]
MAANTPTTDATGGQSLMDERILKAATFGVFWDIEVLATKSPSILLGVTPQGNNCLHISTIHGHEEFCLYALALERSLLEKVNCENETPLVIAVSLGHASLASKLLQQCCRRPRLSRAILQQDRYGFNALHHAIRNGHKQLALDLIAEESALSRAVTKYTESPMFIAVMRNYVDVSEKLLDVDDSSDVGQYERHALHAAARNGNKDPTILDNRGNSAASQLSSITIDDKTLDWKEVHVLMSKADPSDDDISLYNLRKGATKQESIKSRRQRESMTQKYRSNTSLVAILLATITFTAAFTLPGGYSSDSGNAGLPTMSGKVTFIVFLIFDTLAMCSSFVVAFICLMGKWEDDKFTTCFIFVTKKLTWFAYLATVTAFSTGLYPVLAPRLQWLAILICSLVAFFFILTIFIAKWPSMKLSFRLGQTLPSMKLSF